jgi:hypothetical protein
MRSKLTVLPFLVLCQAAAHADDLWFMPTQPPADSSASTSTTVQPQDQPTPADQPVSLSLPISIAAAGQPTVSSAPPPPAPVAAPPVRLPRLTVDVGAAATMPNSDNPPADVSVNVLGGGPADASRVTLQGRMPYGTPVDVRIPEHQLGIHASYILSPNPVLGAPQISIGASFGVNTYGPTETDREGTATLRIGF